MENQMDREQEGGDGRERAIETICRTGRAFSFIRLVQELERLFPDSAGVGESFHFRRDAIRFRSFALLSQPPGDVRSVKRDERQEEAVEITMGYPGLYGVKAPLPNHIFDVTRLVEGDERPSNMGDVQPMFQAAWATRDFLDIFNHRYYAYLYRALIKYRPELANRENKKRVFISMFKYLSGQMGDHMLQDTRSKGATSRLPFVKYLAGIHGHVEGLTFILKALLVDVAVEIEQFVPQWVPVKSPPQLGSKNSLASTLSNNAVVGRSMRDVSGKIRVWLGPLSRQQYASLLPGADKARQIAYFIQTYLPGHVNYDIGLILKTQEIPQAQLGNKEVRLGLSAVLGGRRRTMKKRIVQYGQTQETT